VRSLVAEFRLEQARREHPARLAQVRTEHLLLAEEFRLGSKASVLQERLSVADTDGSHRKALAAPATLALRTASATASIVLERYEKDPATGRRSVATVAKIENIDRIPALTTVPPGSYRLVFRGPGLAEVNYPFEANRGQRIELHVTVPPASSVPQGFVYVPAGEFLFGDADEQLRTQFLDTVPLHARRSPAYLIARHETTYAEWLAFLNSLPEGERARHAPDVSTAVRGSLRLKEGPGGWSLAFQPGTQRYSAQQGTPVHYVGRKLRVSQDWLRFPVAGIAPPDAELYAGWLRRTGRVPGARLCSEAEWERAARGADDRLFPHGDDLAPDDANFKESYGHVDSAFGPDEVGAHPASRSPFGVEDLAGNVFELTVSSQQANQFVIRGGAYYFNSVTSRSTNREVVPPTFRDVTTGIRICASVEGETHAASP
jgi:eukaryotic-like serine/threonine-protein kinase